jgi:hypothetical protein
MVGAALEALIGEGPSADAVAAALSTIPATELADSLRLLARQHGPASVPLLRRCLHGRPEWAIAAAEALASVASQAAADALGDAERLGPPKAVRTALRRALYRLRQAGVRPTPPPPPARPAPKTPVPTAAWVSAVDGTGSRGCWIVFEGPAGERTLLTGVLNDVVGILDVAGGPIAKKRLGDRLRAIREESALPWVEVPPAWAVGLFLEAQHAHAAAGTPVPAELARWQSLLDQGEVPGAPPIYTRIAPGTLAEDHAALEASAHLLEVPELAGWFLDPPAVQTEAVELLQATESPLVITDQIRAERLAALIDRTVESHFGADARQLWRRRLEEQAFVLDATARSAEARQAVAVARALADPDYAPRRIPFVRALVERSLAVAGEVALGRLPVDQVRRVPRPLRAATR